MQKLAAPGHDMNNSIYILQYIYVVWRLNHLWRRGVSIEWRTHHVHHRSEATRDLRRTRQAAPSMEHVR